MNGSHSTAFSGAPVGSGAGKDSIGRDPVIHEAPLRTSFGLYRLVAFEFVPGTTQVAILAGDPGAVDSPQQHPLVRVQSSCITGTVFSHETCDCAQQLRLSMEMVTAESAGCVLYLAQEGLGHGLLEKVAQFGEQAMGYDSVDAASRRGVTLDVREYSDAAWMLNHLVGSRPIRLLTNNPEKIRGLEQAGVQIAERVPCEPEPTEQNRRYLRVKKTRMGHLLSRV